mmetsp:Transcript_6566/g.8106  ORF Transcript_6566/g.8106 Transcript_6566/m.8106 type:complete len:218 (-) Transcript_6566:140-793(-)
MPSPEEVVAEVPAEEVVEVKEAEDKMAKLAKKMELNWGRCVAQNNPPSEEDVWERIIGDHNNSGVIAALLLSMIGPFAVEFPDIMTDKNDWASQAHVTLMGVAMIFTMWATFASFVNYLGLNMVPKTKTYEYMAKLGKFQSTTGTFMILGGLCFMVGWLIYIQKLMPGAPFYICLAVAIIFAIGFFGHYIYMNEFILARAVFPMTGQEITEKHVMKQ